MTDFNEIHDSEERRPWRRVLRWQGPPRASLVPARRGGLLYIFVYDGSFSLVRDDGCRGDRRLRNPWLSLCGCRLRRVRVDRPLLALLRER